MFDFASFFEYLGTFFLNFLNSTLQLFVDLVDAFLVPVVESLPDIELPVNDILSYLSLANYFFAFDYAICLGIAFISFALFVSLINWILGLIPTIN